MKEHVEKVHRYLNPVAMMHVMDPSPNSVLIAGRGSSKSFTNGLKQAKKVELMPRSLGLFTSPTYTMIYTKTLIPMKMSWEQHFGYVEGMHYVVGKVPPKHFDKPYFRPHRYENVVTFWNGRSIMFGSFDRPELISGGSFDDADNDECYLIDKQPYDDFVRPAVRGTHTSFSDCEWFLKHTFTSSMPYKGLGEWLLDYRTKALQNPKKYGFIGWEPNAKVQLGSTFMNYKGLPGGMKAIEAMIAEMDPLSALVMIHNQRVSNWGNLFYPLLAKKHWYTPKANDKVISLSLLDTTRKRDASFDEGPDDYNPDKPINISHDWGVFNTITIDQEYPKEVRFINQMHVHNPKILNDLADEFCEYYRMHRSKLVYQWGDRAGTNKQANAKKNYFDEFADQLRENGWRVVRKATGHVEHMDRHLFINKLHAEQDPRLPIIRYNSKCTDFRIAMESAGMKDNKKDKSSETNPSIKPEHATHTTDAHDYRLYHGLIQREKSSSSSLSTSSSL
jgi:hypothetical protein